MDLTAVLVGFETALSLFLMLRVLVLRLRSVRVILFFLLLPAIFEPMLSFWSMRADYIKLALGFNAVASVCIVAVMYALLATIFNQLPEIRAFVRLLWSGALVAALLTA